MDYYLIAISKSCIVITQIIAVYKLFKKEKK